MTHMLTYHDRLSQLETTQSRRWSLVRGLELCNLVMLARVALESHALLFGKSWSALFAPWAMVFGGGFLVWRLLIIRTVGHVGWPSATWLFNNGNLLWVDVLFSFLMMGGITRSVWPALGGIAALVPAILFRGVVEAYRRSQTGESHAVSGAR